MGDETVSPTLSGISVKKDSKTAKEMFEGEKSIGYWYHKGRNWYFFLGLYKDGEITKAYLDNEEVDPDVLWIMDEPVPTHNLTIWDTHLSSRQVLEVSLAKDPMESSF